MNKHKIDMNKRYATKSGCEVVIYQIHDQPGYGVHGAYKSYLHKDCSCWISKSWTSSGEDISGTESPMDLVELRPRIQRTYFINLYPNNVVGGTYDKRADAAKWATSNRIACVEINIDVEEGEGLTNGNYHYIMA